MCLAMKFILVLAALLSSISVHAESCESFVQNLESFEYFAAELDLGVLLNNRDLLAKPVSRGESTVYRGMRVSGAGLKEILEGGMLASKSDFKDLCLTGTPEVGAWYAIFPFPRRGGEGQNEKLISVIFEIEMNGLNIKQVPGQPTYSSAEDIPASHIKGAYVFDRNQADLSKAFIKVWGTN